MPLFQAAQQTMMRICAVLPNENSATIDVTDECSHFSTKSSIAEFLQCQNSQLAAVIQEFSCLFNTAPGRIDVAYHSIPTIQATLLKFHLKEFQLIIERKYVDKFKRC